MRGDGRGWKRTRHKIGAKLDVRVYLDMVIRLNYRYLYTGWELIVVGTEIWGEAGARLHKSGELFPFVDTVIAGLEEQFVHTDFINSTHRRAFTCPPPPNGLILN